MEENTQPKDLFQDNGIEQEGNDLFGGVPPKASEVNSNVFNRVIDIDTFKKNKVAFEELKTKMSSELAKKEKETKFLLETAALAPDEYGMVSFNASLDEYNSINDKIDALETLKGRILNTLKPGEIEQIKEAGPIGVGEAAKRAIDWKNAPFGAFVEGYRESKIANIMEKVKNSENLTSEEEEYATEWVNQMFIDEIRGTSLGGKIVEGAAALPAYMVEWAIAKNAPQAIKASKAFQKIASATKKVGAISKGLEKLSKASKAIEGGIKKTGKIGELTVKAMKATSTAAQRALFMPQMTYKNYQNLRLNSLYEIGSNGQILFKENQESPATMIFRAYGLSTIEALSEESGETISSLVKRGVSPIFNKMPKNLRDGLVKLARSTDKYKNTPISQMFTKAGYSDMIGEIGEERLGDLLGAITGIQPTDDSYFDAVGNALMPGWDEFLVEAGVLAIPGTVRATTNFLMQKGYSKDFLDNLSTTEQDAIAEKEINKERVIVAEQPVEPRVAELKEEINFLEQEKINPSVEYEPGELDSEIEETKQELEFIQTGSDTKEQQFEIIQKSNPMTDEIHTGIRSKDDIKTFEEAIQDDESFTWGDYSKEDAERDLKRGTVTVYSSHEIKDGTFVSTSKNQAKDYAGNGKIYEMEVPVTNVAWINGDEGQYAPVSTDLEKEETKVRGLSLSTAQRAIQQNIDINQEDLPEYQKRDSADVAKRADEFVRNNKELAVQIVRGEAPEQSGLFRQDLYTALQMMAMEQGDSELLNDLMRSFTTGEATELGQRIQALARISAEYSPVKAMMEVRKERMNEQGISEKKLKSEIEKESKKIKESIKKNVNPKDWEEFIKSLEC